MSFTAVPTKGPGIARPFFRCAERRSELPNRREAVYRAAGMNTPEFD
jgi:hypothetical protein